MSEIRSTVKKQNILFPIQIEDENNDGKYFSSLLKKTKSLVLSNQNYNKFMKKYLIMTQKTSYKLPEIVNYPILKNEYLIPINRQTYTSGTRIISKNKNENIKENLILNNDKEKTENYRMKIEGFSTVLNDNNSNLLPQILLENKLNNTSDLLVNPELVSDDNKLQNIENNLISKDIDTKNKTLNTFNFNINNNINHRNYNEKSKNLKNKKLISENEMMIKNIVRSQSSSTHKLLDKKFNIRSTSDIDISKDFFLKNVYVSNDCKSLIMDLLIDFEFNNKIFNYEEIIRNKYCLNNTSNTNSDEMKKTKIIEKLRNCINSLISGKNENVTSELKKNYEIFDDKVIELKISSLELEFIQYNLVDNTVITHNPSSNSLKLEVRNEYVFDSHLGNNRKNKHNEKTQKIKIPFSLMPLFYYCKQEVFYTILAKIITVNEDFYKSKSEADQVSNKEIKEHQQKGLKCEKENNEPNAYKEEKISIDFETVRKVLEEHKDFIFENENYKKDINNLRSLEWISLNTRHTIRLHPPKLEFYLADNTFNISKKIAKEMLMFLINKSFINWDFFVLNYFSMFKLFRDNLNERFYKKIKQPKLKSHRLTQENITCERSLVLNDFSNNQLALSLDEKAIEPENKTLNTIYFFFTNSNGDTNFFIFNSYELSIFLKSHELIKTVKNNTIEEKVKSETKEYNFKFNMNQLIKLQKLKKFYELKDYLRRMVVIEKKIHHNNCYGKIIKLKNEPLNTIRVDFDLKYFEKLDDHFFKFLTKTDPIKNANSDEENQSILSIEEKEESYINYELKYFKKFNSLF